MKANITAIERAFQLASSARYLTVTEIKLRLHAEGYPHLQIEGPLLHRQLLDVMNKAHAAHHPEQALDDQRPKGRPRYLPADKKASAVTRRG